MQTPIHLGSSPPRSPMEPPIASTSDAAASSPRSSSSQQAQTMALNLDILVLIMSQLEWTTDLLSTMRTCRALHQAGLPFLLREVYLDEPGPFLEFCESMFNDPSRFRFLRCLTLMDIHFRSVRMVDRLASVLQHAEELRELALLCNCEFSFEGDRRIADAVCALRHLDTLHLKELATFEEFDDVFKAMQSRPKKFVLLFDASDIDSISMLQPFVDSLEELSIMYAIFPTQEDDRVPMYPRVRKIVTRLCMHVNTGTMARAYPNLEYFELSLVRDVADDVAAVENMREENLRSQAEASWKTLRYLQGSSGGLYAFAPQCHVRSLRLDHAISIRTGAASQDIHHLVTVLTDTKPLSLYLPVPVADFDVTQLRPLLQACAGSLTHLEISFNDIVFSKGDAVRVLENLFECMQPLRLAYLRVKVLWKDHRLDYQFMNEPVLECPLSPHPTIVRLRGFDFESYARRIADAMPKIQFIFLEISYWLPLYWKVERDQSGGGYTLEALSKDEGLSVVKRMDMI